MSRCLSQYSKISYYTNSIISVKSQYPKNKTNVKFTWRRVYEDMLKILNNNNNEYVCSPLDLGATIQLQIENNNTISEKRTYGPIIIEQQILNNFHKNQFQVWASLQDNNQPFKGIIQFLMSQTVLFRFNVEGQCFYFRKNYMTQRGWDKFQCLPNSGILILEKIYSKQWEAFIQKLNNNKTPASYELKIIFESRKDRDKFLCSCLDQIQTTNSRSYDKICAQVQELFDKSNNRSVQQQSIREHFFYNPQHLSNNKTMLDIFEVLYTPDTSIINYHQNTYNDKKISPKQGDRLSRSKKKHRVNTQIFPFSTENKSKTQNNIQNFFPSKKRKPKQSEAKAFYDEDIKYEQQAKKMMNDPQKIIKLLKENNFLKQQLSQLKNIKINSLKYQQLQNSKHQNSQISQLKNMIACMNDKIIQLQNKIQNQSKKSIKKKQRESMRDQCPQFLKKPPTVQKNVSQGLLAKVNGLNNLVFMNTFSPKNNNSNTPKSNKSLYKNRKYTELPPKDNYAIPQKQKKIQKIEDNYCKKNEKR